MISPSTIDISFNTPIITYWHGVSFQVSDVMRSVKKVRQRQRAQAHDDRAKDLVEVEDELGKKFFQCTLPTHRFNPAYQSPY